MRVGLSLLLLMACNTGSMDVDTHDDQPPKDDTDEEEEVQPEPDLKPERLTTHLEALQAIADAHDGHRSVGSSGYDASTEYVFETLESFGLTPERHAFEVRNYQPVSANLVISGLVLEEDRDYTLMWYSPGGEANAPVQGVDLVLPPGEDANTSTSGCETADFDGFIPGRIALIQRGSCTYEIKASNAAAAGASGVIIFNEGQSGRTEVVGGALSQSHSGDIPVVFTTFDVGVALSTYDGDVYLQTVATTTVLSQDNVLATRPGTSGKRWILGAHLDSVPAGPGINDNGTGVAVILEVGRMVSQMDSKDAVTVAFWGAEEIGLVGSSAYAASLSSEEVDNVSGYLNLDMVGSPNPGRFIYAGDLAVAPNAPGTEALGLSLASWFDATDRSWKYTSVGGRSDHAGFVARGILSGGYFTGAEQNMSTPEANEWGGTANQAFDPCYHRACDSIDNVNMTMLIEMSTAIERTLSRLLFPAINPDKTSLGPFSPGLDVEMGCQHKETM